MKIIRTVCDLTVPVERGRRCLALHAGIPYVMHDVEVISGLQARVIERVEKLPASPMPFRAEIARAGSVIVPFIGGLGDAVSMQPLIRTMAHDLPGLEIDVTTTPGPAEVFDLMPHVRQVRAYPLTLEAWCVYDCFLSMERVQETVQRPGRSLPETFASAAGIALRDSTVNLDIPPESTDVHAVLAGRDGPLVGLVADDGSSHRAYPGPLIEDLARHLARCGITVVLLGTAGDAGPLAADAGRLIDLRGRTDSANDLVACLRRLDAVVAHDSFVMHLAGAIGRPTIGLFAPTTVRHADPYDSVQPLCSAAACAPCHEAGARCPKGFPSCLAWHEPSISPRRVAEAVLHVLELDGTSPMDAASRCAEASASAGAMGIPAGASAARGVHRGGL